MAKPARFFFTGPARLIADQRPTALDLRVLAAVAFHDGMSGVSGKGGGCYAKHSTLAALVGTDVSNFSKSLSRLISWGYIAREPQLMDKRRFTLRVIYGDDDSWRTDQQSPAEIVGEGTNPEPEIVGEADAENGSFSRQTGEHYISLNEELHFDKSKKLNSSKRRDLGFQEKDGGEPPAIQWALGPHLPSNFTSLPPGAQLQRFEEAFAQLGRDPDRLHSREREAFAEYLHAIGEDFAVENVTLSNHAMRLWEEVATF